jgi:hypothetical protein
VNILLVASNNKQFLLTVTEDLNSNHTSSIPVMISYIVLNADSYGEFSTLRPETKYYCSVVSIPSSYLGGPRFEFSMEGNHTDYYYCSFPSFFQANDVIVP